MYVMPDLSLLPGLPLRLPFRNPSLAHSLRGGGPLRYGELAFLLWVRERRSPARSLT